MKGKGGSGPAGRVKAQPLLAGEDVTGGGLSLLLKLDLVRRGTPKGSMSEACGKIKWEQEETWGMIGTALLCA